MLFPVSMTKELVKQMQKSESKLDHYIAIKMRNKSQSRQIGLALERLRPEVCIMSNGQYYHLICITFAVSIHKELVYKMQKSELKSVHNKGS